MDRENEDKTTLRGEPPRSVGTRKRASLVLYHRDGAKVVPLVAGSPVVVGRTYPADAVIADDGLSRRHAQFSWENDGFFVEDLGSTNGTTLKGAPLVGRARLSPGDEVRLGGVTATVHVLAPQEEELRGIEGHDRFVAILEDELVRARTFGRPLSLLMVHASDMSARLPAIREKLRPVDRLGAYAPGTLLILLPELARAQAQSTVTAVSSSEVRCGIATFPDEATTSEEMIEAVRRSARGEALAAHGERVPPATSSIVIASPRMREVYDTVARVSASSLPVLILGETGAGKEVIARAIHEGSARKKGPLRCINCAAIPATLLEGMLFGHEKGAFTGADRATKGIFEQASGGTVLLDEIGELAPAAQAALLRVLENKRVTRLGSDRETEVDVRIVAATHRDLHAMAEAGTFRWDLLYRLDAMTLALPPLRERREDIAPLAELFLREANRENGRAVRDIEPRAAKVLEAYRWPGNVRELRNVIDRAVVITRGDRITLEDLPERVRAAAPATSDAPPPTTSLPPDDPLLDYKERVRQRMQAYETDLILEALERHQGNQTEAAKALGMPVRTLAHKIQQYGIKKKFEAK